MITTQAPQQVPPSLMFYWPWRETLHRPPVFVTRQQKIIAGWQTLPTQSVSVSSFPLSQAAPSLESCNDVTPDLQQGRVFFPMMARPAEKCQSSPGNAVDAELCSRVYLGETPQQRASNNGSMWGMPCILAFCAVGSSTHWKNSSFVRRVPPSDINHSRLIT